MKFNAKSAWAWFCGIASGPIMCYAPYISQWNFSKIPPETHGSAVMLVLAGIGLINMKRPSEHSPESIESGDGATL